MITELYNVKNNTMVRVLEDIAVPPGAPKIKAGDEILFSHIDGMYSLCFDSKGNPVHLVAWAKVEEIKDAGE